MNTVVGATGFLGSAICRLLAAKGEPVRALVRVTSGQDKVEALKEIGVEVI